MELTVPATPARWPFVIVVLIALIAMGRSVGGEWSFYDDDLFLTRNPTFNPPTLDGLAGGWSHPFRGLWTPVTHTAWWLCARLAYLDAPDADGTRLNPWMFHAANLLVHCVTCAFAYALIRRLVRNDLAALAGATLFAAHPVQVEAVAWACGTKDLLAGMLTLATLCVATSTWRRRSVIAIALAALAMLSKPSAAMLPALLFAYGWARRVRPTPASPASTDRLDAADVSRSGDAGVAPTTMALLAAMAVATLVIARRVQDVADVPHVTLLARPLVALDALAVQFAHVAWPVGLCADYGLTPAQLLASSRRWWTSAVPVVAALLAWRSRDRAILGGALVFLIALAPNLGLSPFQFQVYSTVADRYAYVALLGVAIVVARAVDHANASWRGQLLATCVLAVTLCVLAVRQCGSWHDARSLWERVLAVNPRSSLAHNNLGAVDAQSGDLRGALAHFQASADNAGAADAFALLNLVQVNVRLGDARAAADALVRWVAAYRARSEFDADLARKTIDRFTRDITRLDPAVAADLRAKVGL